MKEIFITGTGLIGGSIALEIQRSMPHVHITGTDNNRQNAQHALRLGIIHEIRPPEEGIERADLVILAVPVDAAVKLLPGILSGIGNVTAVMDVGSTKRAICESVKLHPGRKNFVATHPMAGTEYSGPAAAVKNLFMGKAVVICEKEKSNPALLDRVTALYECLGMRMIYMQPEEHDLHTAYISHLSHVLSYALAITVLQKEKDTSNIFDLASSGFGSTARLAKSHAAMWAPIFTENSALLDGALHDFMHNLGEFRKAIREKDTAGISALINEANRIKKIVDVKKDKTTA